MAARWTITIKVLGSLIRKWVVAILFYCLDFQYDGSQIILLSTAIFSLICYCVYWVVLDTGSAGHW